MAECTLNPAGRSTGEFLLPGFGAASASESAADFRNDVLPFQPGTSINVPCINRIDPNARETHRLERGESAIPAGGQSESTPQYSAETKPHLDPARVKKIVVPRSASDSIQILP